MSRCHLMPDKISLNLGFSFNLLFDLYSQDYVSVYEVQKHTRLEVFINRSLVHCHLFSILP